MLGKGFVSRTENDDKKNHSGTSRHSSLAESNNKPDDTCYWVAAKKTVCGLLWLVSIQIFLLASWRKC